VKWTAFSASQEFDRVRQEREHARIPQQFWNKLGWKIHVSLFRQQPFNVRFFQFSKQSIDVRIR
jgi:hypothetical protein